MLGVRNPWRFSFDRANGDLWVGDVGQNEIEEVDHVAWPLGGLLNFGWDVYEGSSSLRAQELGPGRLVSPVAQYSHDDGCSVIGGYVYRGSAVPAARAGTSSATTAREPSGRSSSRTASRRTCARSRSRSGLTSFGEDRAGELYLVSGEGAVYRLTG